MNATIHSLSKKWSANRSTDPYASVEEFADTASSELWPYAVIIDQIESGWSDEFRGALALHLAKRYNPEQQALAAFVILSGQWPSANATTSLNLLSLAHACRPSPQASLDRFVSYAALRCLRQGLLTPPQLVSEETVNILGGFGPHHFVAATSAEISTLTDLVAGVIDRIDDHELAVLLRDRAASVLSSAQPVVVNTAIGAIDAHRMLKDLEPMWHELAPTAANGPLVAILRTHVAALAWTFASGSKSSAIQVVYAYANKLPQVTEKLWGVIEPWMAVVRELSHANLLEFQPVSVAAGSLLVTLRIDADGATNETIATGLRAAKSAPQTSAAVLDLLDRLRQRGVNIRVAHVDADLGSTSFGMAAKKSEGGDRTPLRSRKLTTHEVPQANEWQRIFSTVDAIASGEQVTETALGVTTARQVQYYKAASRILGFIIPPADELTPIGWLLHVAVGDERYRRARAAFEVTPCGQSWIEWSNGTKLSDVRDGSATAFLSDRSELTGDTIQRRANTLEVWLKALREY